MTPFLCVLVSCNSVQVAIHVASYMFNEAPNYYLNPTISRLSLLLHKSEAKSRTSVNNNDNLRV